MNERRDAWLRRQFAEAALIKLIATRPKPPSPRLPALWIKDKRSGQGEIVPLDRKAAE